MHRLAKRLFVLAMVIHFVPSAAFADRLVDGVPIPDDAKVMPPSLALPESQQRFLGAWVGRWGDALKHILIVESVQARWQRQCHLRLGRQSGPEHHARLYTAWRKRQW